MTRRMMTMLSLAALTCAAGCTSRSTGAARSPADCRSSELALAKESYGEGLLQFRQTFTLTNVAHMRCRLRGWPTFQLVNASGRLVPTHTQRVRQNSPRGAAWRTVVLAPQQTAAFDVFGADFDAARDVACPKTFAAVVVAPHGTTRMSVRVRIPDCGLFYVAPVIAGRTDRAAWSVVVR